MADKKEQPTVSEEEEIPEQPFELEIPSGKTKGVSFPEDDLDLIVEHAFLKREGEGDVILECTTRFISEADMKSDVPVEPEEETTTIAKFGKNDIEIDLDIICTSDMDPHFTVKGPGTVTLKGVFSIVILGEEEEEFPEEEDENQGKK